MSILGMLKSALGGKTDANFNEDDVRIEPLQVDKSVPLNNARPDFAGAKGRQAPAQAAAPGRRGTEAVTAKVERVEQPAEKGALRYLSPAKDVFMAEVSETVTLMVNMADFIDQNYELMSDDERREVVRVVRTLRMFLAHGKSLEATESSQ